MPDFNPSPNEFITIGGRTFSISPHPAVPSFAFGQEGRKAYVFQVRARDTNEVYALKKFKLAFRVPELVEVCEALAGFSRWRGLEVCNRVCLNSDDHPDILTAYPDLEYAVLMPWIIGSTWYDLVIGMTPLNRLEAVTFANGVAQVLSGLEEAGVAHCDISAANIIINPNTGRAHLIDVEDMYAPGFQPPNALPAGTDGYAHKTAFDGIWEPLADRFAGAVIIAEMAAWHDPRIRKEAEDEHYFAGDEMQEESPRYRLMMEVLGNLDSRLAELFEQAWFSTELDDAPTLKQWQDTLGDVHHRESLSEVVSDWKPLIVPGVETTPAPAAPPVKAPPRKPVPEAVPESEVDAAGDEAKPETAPASVSTPEPQPARTIPPAIQTPMPPPAAPAPVPLEPGKAGGPVVTWTPLVVPGGGNAAPSREFTPIMPQTQPQPKAIPVGPSTPEEDRTLPFEAADSFSTPEAREDVSPPEGESASYQPEADYHADDPVEAEYVYEPVREKPEAAPAPSLTAPILNYTEVDRMNRPHLVWSESYGAAEYLLQESKTPGFESPKEVRISGSENTQWKPAWGRSGRLYYRIKAITEDGRESRWSEVVGIRVGK